MTKPRKIDPQLKALLQGLARTDSTGATSATSATRAASAAEDADATKDTAHAHPPAPQADAIAALRDGYQRMHSTDPTQFRVGDIVRWQPRLKNARWPEYGEPAVVVECLSPPILRSNPHAGTPYFREPSSLVLGLQRDDGFHCWHHDGRRFERV